MRRIRAHIVPTVGRLMLGLLALFPMGPHTATGLLLCIEAEGRIHVEGVADGKGAVTELLAQWEVHELKLPFASATSTTQWKHWAEETRCVDIPLLLSPTDGYGQWVRASSFVLVVAVVGIPWIPVHWNPRTIVRLAETPVFLPHYAAALRTIILRL